ncbi:MAG: hypothetical protein ACJ74W_10325 [Pyrinomonadaceae bacterium]
MNDYAHESATEGEFLREERAPRVSAAAIPAGTPAPTPERSSHHRLLASDAPHAPRLTVNLPAVGAYHFAPPRRDRSPLTPVLFTILAFALGALVSLWLFNRARAAAPRSRAHVAAPDTTSSAPHLAKPSAVDTSVSERSIVRVVEPRAADVKDLAGPDDKRPAPSKDVRPNNSARENIPAPPPTKPVAPRAISERTMTQAKVTPGGGCALSTSKSRLTLSGGGGAAEITVSLGSLTGPAPITASTNDWANIVVFAGARRAGVSMYRIVSVSQRPGTYGVTLRSPCGTKHIAVIVE